MRSRSSSRGHEGPIPTPVEPSPNGDLLLPRCAATPISSEVSTTVTNSVCGSRRFLSTPPTFAVRDGDESGKLLPRDTVEGAYPQELTSGEETDYGSAGARDR